MEKTTFVKGEYRWAMRKQRFYSKRQWVIGILKGGELVGVVAYHPKAKQLAFSPKTSITLPLVMFIAPLMDPHLFHRLAKKHADRNRND